MKISFDYDDTLSEHPHYLKAIKHIKDGDEVWIVTRRLSDDKAPSNNWNDDLWRDAKYLNIPKERVIFTGLSPKYEFFIDKDFDIHYDDDPEENRLIEIHTNTKTVTV